MQNDSSSSNEDQKEGAQGVLTKGLETIAETVGVVAGLASRAFAPIGNPNAVQMLRADHVLVEDLFEQFEQTEDNRKRADIVRSTLDELEVHAALEEQIVYPAIRGLDNEKEHQDKMDEALEEHHVVKQLIAELRKMTPQDERFAAKFTVLSESVRHHVREEESEVLPKAEESDLDLDALARQMAERKQQLMQKTNLLGSQLRSGEGKRGVTRRKPASAGRAGSGRAGATGKATVLAGAGRAGANGKRSLSRQTRKASSAGKGRASTRTGATSTQAGRLSGKKARGVSKTATRTTSTSRSGGRAAGGRKRTRS